MNKKRGFALIESIFMIVFISMALLIVYKAFSTSFQDERKRVNYDSTNSIYKTYFLKQYFEENGLLDYLTTVTLTNGYLVVTCDTLASVNDEYCDFLTGSGNFDVTKMYITKLDMSGITYTGLDATTIDYMKTLSNSDTSSYRFTVWYGDEEYGSLKIGDPFYYLRVYLDGGTWDGINPQKLIEGDTTDISEPTKDGYVFDGWNIIGDGSTIVSGVLTMGTEDTSLVAAWREPIYDFVYTGSYQTFTAPFTGYYNVELWGAQGGSGSAYVSNLAAKTSGQIYLQANDVIYVYVGGAGISNCTSNLCLGGYNGGGKGGGNATSGVIQGSGGGSTDIRYGGQSMNDRIMVAGGSGGGSSYLTNWYGTGGGGGRLIGLDATYGGASGSANYPGLGGTQIAGGLAANCVAGTFGAGGTRDSDLAGGGGGYYGGGCGWGAGGGGGSSFISGYAGDNAITSSSSTTATNNTIHYSNKYFINGEMQLGINAGNGSAKISYVGLTAPAKTNTNLNNVRYIKDCINGSTANASNHWVELQAIYQGTNVAKGKTVTGTVAQNVSPYLYSRITDGDVTSANYAESSVVGLQCITVDLGQIYNLDEIAVWHYWADGRTYYSNTTSVSSDNTTWTSIIANTNAETSQGKRINTNTFEYGYTGNVQTFTIPITGNYTLETWGASGGSTTYRGGYGGYSKGTVYLEQNTVISVYVGGAGNSSVVEGAAITGSYNGGGSGYGKAGGGGGATHIATVSGILPTLSGQIDKILIVAGGGGGSVYYSDNFASSIGGSGGGYIGEASTPLGTWSIPAVGGRGGTQIAGGLYGTINDGQIYGISGSFGAGANGAYDALNYNPGGGGGFYGGGMGRHVGGGGGSGYIGNSTLYSKYMFCYNCPTSSTASTLTYSTTNVSSIAISNYAKTGNGYARITYLWAD